MEWLRLHPLIVTKEIVARYGSPITLQFSRYVYRRQQVFDERTTFDLEAHDVTPERVIELINSLSPDEELALHSTVRVRGRRLHIPMIDFSVNTWGAHIVTHLRNYLPRPVFKELMLFDSGRSFHAYSLRLLKPSQWHDFLGRLLLLNLPGETAIVDTRWIGHRLIGGYGALRWSCNTSHYRAYPKRVPFQIHSETG